MGIVPTLLSLCLAWPGAETPVAATSPEVTIEEVAAHFEKRQQWLDGRVVCITYQTLAARNDQGLPGPFKPPENLDKHFFQGGLAYRIGKWGKRYHCERWEGGDSANCPDKDAWLRIIWTFDGANYITIHRDQPQGGLYNISLTGEEQRPDPGALDFCGWWVFGQNTRRESFADYLRSDRLQLLETVLLEDGRTRITCAPDRTIRQTEELEFICSREPNGEVVVTEANMLVYKSEKRPRSKEDLRLFSGIQYGPVDTSSGWLIPRTATYTSYMVADRSEDSYWGVNLLTCVGVEEREPERELLHPEPSPPVNVGDGRYRVGYQLGASLLNIDGRILKTHVPVAEPVVTRLDWWVANGTWVTPDKGAEAAAKRTNVSSSSANTPGSPR